ncbi:MAG: tRNA pseudouridine(38-40) synthase TruA [Bdellovibrionales bacterium]|nr:tRNA pseudouridine(38-40) synthase TruA [Bdellovibrionales bacterium]
MPNVKLVVEYNGSGFHGWQIQPGLRTIEGELKRVLETILRQDIHAIYAAGRTDSGVHARGQVVNFYLPVEPDLRRLRHSVSSIMRTELSVKSAEIVPDEFHARRSSISKTYRYTVFHQECPPVLDRGQVWHVGAPLDLDRMQKEAETLVGVHDFSSLRGAGCRAHSAVKEVFESGFVWSAPYLIYSVKGRGFLKQMVRNIVGTLVGFGRGRIALPNMPAVLEARDRRVAGVTAPAYGLLLEEVHYGS